MRWFNSANGLSLIRINATPSAIVILLLCRLPVGMLLSSFPRHRMSAFVVLCAISVSAFASPLIPSEIHHSPDREMREDRDKKMTIFRDKNKKNDTFEYISCQNPCICQKKAVLLYIFLHIAKLGFICLRTAHTALIANEIPLLPYGGIRIPRLRSHTVSNPQTNATLSQAVPAIRGCRLRVYIDNI